MAEHTIKAPDEGLEKTSGQKSAPEVVQSADGARRASRSAKKLDNLNHMLERLRCSGKIERAAFLDLQGTPLVRSSGMDISPDDGETILRTLNSPFSPMTRLRVGKQDFVCFKNTGTSLVGKSDDDFLCVYRGTDFVVVGISDPQSPGSSIYEISRFLSKISGETDYADDTDNC